jgi:UDP-N-acetylglucosamine 2-epimerase (non-hydrolysing)
VIYPAHPRAAAEIDEAGLDVPAPIEVVSPLDYLGFLVLQDAAALLVTDSGGVQEESCVLGTPCVTLRDETERPETVDVGSNLVVGTTSADIVDGCVRMHGRSTDWENPFGDGDAAGRILDVLASEG